jgi:aspartate 1-decarboxylase
VASSQSVTTAFATPVLITLVATGNGTLTYAVAAQPLHGSVSLSGAVATYTPTAGYSGVDSFTFTASSGQVSNAAKVSITVLPAPPVAASQTIAAASFNAAEAITLSATGATPITYAIVAQPAHGTVTLAGAVATYTPAVNFAGNDSFTFTASNAGGTSNVATVSVSVTEGFTWYAASGGSLSASVTNGQTATFNLAIGGWTGASGVSVAFTCVGAPVLCNVTPNPVTLSGATPVPVTVTINTLTTTVTPTSFGWLPGSGKGGPWLLLLNLVWLVFFVPQARRRRAIWRVSVALAAVVTLASVTGCGGNIPEKAFGTPAGTYAFTVSATAAATTTATQTITLIVN